MDSNHDSRFQRPLSCPWTNRECYGPTLCIWTRRESNPGPSFVVQTGPTCVVSACCCQRREVPSRPPFAQDLRYVLGCPRPRTSGPTTLSTAFPTGVVQQGCGSLTQREPVQCWQVYRCLGLTRRDPSARSHPPLNAVETDRARLLHRPELIRPDFTPIPRVQHDFVVRPVLVKIPTAITSTRDERVVLPLHDPALPTHHHDPLPHGDADIFRIPIRKRRSVGPYASCSSFPCIPSHNTPPVSTTGGSASPSGTTTGIGSGSDARRSAPPPGTSVGSRC
jgi:hypothetical protein